MRKLRFICDMIIMLLICNSPALWALCGIGSGIKTAAVILLTLFYLTYLITSGGRQDQNKKLDRIAKGSYMLSLSVVMLIFETAAIIIFIITGRLTLWRQLANGLTGYGLIALSALAGILRTAISARQVKLIWYVLLMIFWYVPILNIIILTNISKAAKKEFRFEQAKQELDFGRKESEVCKTKYPILMVHGIFFRDWQIFNYWGRIPAELAKNGAEIYYGKQQSAELIEVSAGEIRDRILQVIEETGAEKVNIIAHSKGGIDSRYAISCLGMDRYVASLITINSPHYGCKFVDKILSKVSDDLLGFVEKRYNKLYTVLGDTKPDFVKGLQELTFERCSRLDEEAPDKEGVYYLSVMSKMKNVLSAGFPQNISYLMNKPYGTGNDGLVTVESALRGDNTLMIEHEGTRGLSHGDLIDLMRENIDGFDVREFYVNLVKDLKEKGL